MIISSYTKSVCFVHIAGLLSLNSNANCERHRYQTSSHFSCSVNEKRERSADCMQAFSNLPVLSMSSVSDGCFTIGNMSNCPSCVVLSHQLQKCEKEDSKHCANTFTPRHTLIFSGVSASSMVSQVDTISRSRNWHRRTSSHQALLAANHKTTGAHNMIRKPALDPHNHFPLLRD